jgi:capsular exopolysaccharide synthesis family protein
MSEELEMLNNPKSRVAEAIKTIRTNLDFNNIDGSKKRVLLTSSQPGEGKSFIAACLAYSYAATGKKVLIIDCDLRRGRQSSLFGVLNKKGLSNLLITDLTDVKIVPIQTKINNVYLIPSGVVPPNPSELLGSSNMSKLISLLENDFDVIIFDCPPVIGLSDTLIITKYVDYSIVVASYKDTPIEALKKTCKSLEAVNAKIAGIVFNKVAVGGRGYYGNYGYYGSYYE